MKNILQENMKRFGTKNLNEQISLEGIHSNGYVRTREDDLIAVTIEDELRKIRNTLSSSAGKGIFDDDEDVLRYDFKKLWDSNIKPLIAKLNSKDPNKKIFTDLFYKIDDRMGSAKRKILPGVMYQFYLRTDSDGRSMVRPQIKGIEHQSHKNLPGGVSLMNSRFHSDI